MITSGEGKYRVWLEEKKIGDDRLYILGGGEKPHIGSIVIYNQEKTNIIRLKGHYDDIVLKPIAERAYEKYGTTIVVLGGVHIDNAKKEEIDKIVNNCRSMISCI